MVKQQEHDDARRPSENAVQPPRRESPFYRTPQRPGQPGWTGERRPDPVPNRPPAKKPYPRDAEGPKGT